MTLADVLHAIRTRWIWLVLAVVIGAASAVGLALATPKTYVATATIALRWIGPDPGVAELANVRYLSREAQTVALLVDRPDVLERADSHLDAAIGSAAIAGRVEATVPVDAQLVRVAASAERPGEAAELANAVAGTMVSTAANGAVSANVDTTLAVEASSPAAPIAPRRSLYLAAGAAVGMIVGVAAVLAGRSPRGVRINGGDARIARLRPIHLVWALLVAAVIPWRTGSFYEGALDPVVLAKAGLSVLAVVASLAIAARADPRVAVAAQPVLLLSLYLVVTVLGGIANGTTASAVIVAVRMSLLMAAICLLAVAHPPLELVRSLVHVLAVLMTVGALSGLPSYSGRLRGVVPVLHPNLLAMLASIVAIWLVAKVFTSRESGWELLALGACVAIVVLTGSRTSLAALGMVVAARLLRMTSVRMRTVALAAVAVPLLTFAALGTDVLRSLVQRGADEDLSNLSNRTIAWRAAVSLDRDGWQTWLGQGLAQKTVRVPGQWWDTQMLDSSWMSALVQGGYLGLTIVVFLTLATLLRALFAPRSDGPLWLGLVLYLALRGFLESGLFDGNVSFMLFLIAALGAFAPKNREPHQRPSFSEPAVRPMAAATSAGNPSAIVAS